MALIEYKPPTDPWIEVVFEDADILVVNKPSGLLSVPGREPQALRQYVEPSRRGLPTGASRASLRHVDLRANVVC